MIYRYHQNESDNLSEITDSLIAKILPLIARKYPMEVKADLEGWKAFRARMKMVLPVILEKYFSLYSNCIAAWPMFSKLIECMAVNWLERRSVLKEIDAKRIADPDWYKSSEILGGICYVDRFAGDFKHLIRKIPFFTELGVNYVHLMPFFKTIEGDNDGGYAVSSYRDIDPALGTIDDLIQTADEFHKNGIVLVVDFVFNHTSSEHEWAKKAMKGDLQYEAYYWMYSDRQEPDRYERTLREIFPDEHPGVFTWFPKIEKWVWTTFHSYQWDLNYQNPEVLVSMANEMLHLSNLGVDVLRLDAAAFIWKRQGTCCESLPETYTLIEIFNKIAAIAAPSLLFKSEAIVHPNDVIRYIGKDCCQISYNPLLMALLWESLATRETKLLAASMKKRFNLPEHTSWVNYIRCHDDIGWTFSDEDASTLGIHGYPHRQFLNAFYTGRFPGSFASGLPFQENPRTGDCRISGMLASLAGLEKAITENDQNEMEFAISRIVLMFGIILFIGGIPLIYLGDEIGMCNNYSFKDDPVLENDSRWVHRCRYDWEKWKERKNKRTVTGEIWTRIKALIEIRKANPVFSEQNITVLSEINPHVFAFMKQGKEQSVVIIANFSEHTFQLDGSGFLPQHDVLDEISGSWKVPTSICFEPYQLMAFFDYA